MTEREKRFITVETDDGIIYYGRLLGLIDDAEFHHTITDRKIQNKTFSVETKHLKDIVDGYDDLDGLRLVVALKKINNQEVAEKLLFISEKLDMVAYVSPEYKVGLMGKNNEWLTVTEEVK